VRVHGRVSDAGVRRQGAYYLAGEPAAANGSYCGFVVPFG